MPLVRPGAAISFKNILFLTDFGQASSGALAYSLAFARHFKARLYPAHVMDTVFTAPGAIANEGVVKEMEEQKRRQLSRLVEYNGINFQPLLSWCDFEAALSYWISEHSIDLVVAGTHGRRGVPRFLGSTSEAVLHNAPCPVSRSDRTLRYRVSSASRWTQSYLPLIWADNRSMFLDTLFHWPGINARA